jgi:S1/P1 Nuclease
LFAIHGVMGLQEMGTRDDKNNAYELEAAQPTATPSPIMIAAAVPAARANRPGFRLLWILSLVLLAAPDAMAWNDTGHMVVALIAHDALSTALQQNAGALLRKHPRFAADFAPKLPRGLRDATAAEQNRWYIAFAATWPDLARHFGHVEAPAARAALVDRYHHGGWHYINLPTYLRPGDARQLNRPMPSMAWQRGQSDAELNLVQALARVSADLCSADAADAERALALCWLLHLLADLHQPLHTTSLYSVGVFANGDRGGNDIAVRGAGNLHALWDGALGNDRRWRRVVAAAAQYRAGAAVEPTVDFPAWAREGRDLAARSAYSEAVRDAVASAAAAGPVRISADASYRRVMYSTAQTQIGRAGARTARVIAPLLGAARGAGCTRAALAFLQSAR